MSPASKSKSKDKKFSKESQKSSSKPSGPASDVSDVPASAYNPLLGTFHTIETVPSSSASPLRSNGRLQNIDETEHLEGALSAGVEYDTISNNGSWSGESEEHKEKTSNLPVRQEIIPGADNDKREKIRQKNEKKHQRQKERRAQELHERCCGYLMSRKLEALAQQLVAMGFSHDQATMALIFKEGKVEESVAWLFEGSEEEAVKHKESTIGGGNLKIDISEELARIADMEIRYKCTKQEVERAVVAAEGDLEKAAESLRSLKQDSPAPPKPEGTCDPLTDSTNKLSVAGSQNTYLANAAVTVRSSSDLVSKNLQLLKRIQSKLEWAKSQQSALPAEKSWASSGSNPSVSYSLASTLQASPPAKTETLMAMGSDFKKFQPSLREPVIMMQRPQSVNTKQVPATSISSSPPGSIPFMYSAGSVEIIKSNAFMPHIASARSLGSNNMSSNQIHHQLHYPQQQHFTVSSSPGDSPGTSRGNGLWSRSGALPTLAAASSLGLFAGSGSTTSSGSSSPVDWSSGSSMSQLDYTNVDWSLERGLSSRPGGIWLGPTSLLKSTYMHYPTTNGLSAKPAMRLTPNASLGPIAGLQDGGVAPTEASPTAGSHEWTSPFEGKDLFSLPRQYVSSPTI